MSARTTEPKTLLIVDDDWRFARMLEWSFDDLGYAAQTAGSLAEARQVLSTLQFDYALIDLGLPDGSGATLGHQLLAARPAARVALMSTDAGAVQSTASALADHVGDVGNWRVGGIGKPVRPGRLHRWFSAG